VAPNAVGILLTGMGADGAQGLKALQSAGVPTIAQDMNTSVVWGMPGAAVKLGAADAVLALDDIPAAILDLCGQAEGIQQQVSNGDCT
jgi:two-component system chemotaxis response regulator CheB